MPTIERRTVIGLGAATLGAAGIGLALSACGGGRPEARGPKGERASDEHEEEEVAPSEDLMREHGVLNRLLLVYEESARRLEQGGPPAREVLDAASEIIRRFVEDYHEKLEEDFVFPRFEKAGRLTALVVTLRRQHAAGRRVTEDIRKLVGSGAADEPSRKQLVLQLRAFVRMYRPHEAREDTVLFPALPTVVEPKELAALGETFEHEEHEIFGKAGFEGVVEQVAKLERALGIYELDQFTP